ncbi:MAG: phage tail assembly protein [Proteobacteria bacterium]|nr:phage tail assembly protein [Pseudomonadota bacterium]
MEKITLEYPVENNGKNYSELSMRRPVLRDMLVAEKKGGSDLQKESVTFSNLCEVTPEVIQALDMKDYKKLQAVYTGFLS